MGTHGVLARRRGGHAWFVMERGGTAGLTVPWARQSSLEGFERVRWGWGVGVGMVMNGRRRYDHRSGREGGRAVRTGGTLGNTIARGDRSRHAPARRGSAPDPRRRP